jgi:hypothetical protein
MQATYLPPVAAPKFALSAKVFVLLLASGLISHVAAAQATTPSPAAAAANADMLSWMAHGLLAAVIGLTVLTCFVLLIAFTTSRRADSRPLAPAQTPAASATPATPANPVAATPVEVRAATTSERMAA